MSKSKNGPALLEPAAGTENTKVADKSKIKKGERKDLIESVIVATLSPEEPPAALWDPETRSLILSLPRGDAGSRGPAGPQGTPGLQGASGPKGETGPQGFQGPQGPQGMPGSKGESGLRGEVGAEGPAGPMGPQGLQGPVGPRGDAGTGVVYSDAAMANRCYLKVEADGSLIYVKNGTAIVLA